ncbi:winged helix-turn-helix domain-containing protein [Clostridium aminobutyricum]|uniref:Stage 0 sporulation protein A homolog n=1 Tax=Clostridium aminobutyricum TaxID=33953 RepID=A0A939IJ26_CLOAM|nr:response regulator transcription factor [Clostridium aminobutyricum]MBN7773129.1 response regulator transcription factor [Clostridium aminobutyricum]
MIFCVEDDSSIRELVVYTLKNTGFEAEGFADSTELFLALSNKTPELILLDIMLPGMDGIDILKRIKKNKQTENVPVIMLTAKGSEYDKVIGLDNGADDYVSKPFGMMELVSRVKAVLRRTQPKENKAELQCGNLCLNAEKHLVTANGQSIVLTFKEFELLRILMENKGMVLSRDKLLEKIWGYDFDGETRTVDVHVRTLRQKLGEAGQIIETIRGVGYLIGEEPKESLK